MKFGAQLPLMDFGGNPYTISHLASYARRAVRQLELFCEHVLPLVTR